MALAVVLRATPTQLLLPQLEAQAEVDTASIEVTGLGHVTESEAWAWASANFDEVAEIDSSVREQLTSDFQQAATEARAKEPQGLRA